VLQHGLDKSAPGIESNGMAASINPSDVKNVAGAMKRCLPIETLTGHAPSLRRLRASQRGSLNSNLMVLQSSAA